MFFAKIIPFLCLLLSSTHAQIGGIPGGWSNADVNDPGVKNVSTRAVQLYSASTNNGLAMQLVKVVQAKTQVVSGMNYNVTLIVGLLGCDSQEANSTPSACTIEKVATCQFIVYVQSWTNTFQLTTSSCSSFTTAWTPISLYLKTVNEAITVSLREITSLKSNAGMVKYSKVDKAYVNKWIPSLYRIYLTVFVNTNINKKIKIHITVKVDKKVYTLMFCKTSDASLSGITKCTTAHYSV